MMSDPEWPELVRIFNARCNTSCRLMGGHVIGHRDRGLLVRFGYPATGERYAESAVSAGLEMVAEARERPLVSRESGPSPPRWLSKPAPSWSSRAGSSTHLSDEIARLESDGRAGCGGRQRGGAAAGARRSSLMTPRAPARRADELPHHRRATPTRARDRRRAPPTPFTGRELELARLERWWREADNGKGQVVLVTRRGRARQEPDRPRAVATDSPSSGGLGSARLELHQNTPLFPFVEMITHAFGLDHADTGEAREPSSAGSRRAGSPRGRAPAGVLRLAPSRQRFPAGDAPAQPGASTAGYSSARSSSGSWRWRRPSRSSSSARTSTGATPRRAKRSISWSIRSGWLA